MNSLNTEQPTHLLTRSPVGTTGPPKKVASHALIPDCYGQKDSGSVIIGLRCPRKPKKRAGGQRGSLRRSRKPSCSGP